MSIFVFNFMQTKRMVYFCFFSRW